MISREKRTMKLVSFCFGLLTPAHVIEAKIKGDYNAGLIIAQRYHQC